MVILPFVYSRKSMEPALSPRFMFESAFLLAYHIYFFGFRKEKYILHLNKLAGIGFVLFGAFVVWSGISMSVSINLEESIYEVSRNVLNLLLLFTVIHAVVTDKFNLISFCRFVAVAALVHSFIGFDEYFEWGHTKFPGGASPHGLMANRNLFGSAQALVFPFVIYLVYKDKGVWKFLSVLITFCLIGSLYVSQTRAAWISGSLVFVTVVGISYWLIPEYRKKSFQFVITCLVSCVIILGLVQFDKALNERPKPKRKVESLVPKQKKIVKETYKNDTTERKIDKADINTKRTATKQNQNSFLPFKIRSESVKERLVVWQESIGIIKDSPVFGVGPGNWKVSVPYYRIGGIRNDYGKIVRIRPHNIYVQILTENGFIGMVLYFGAWILVLIMAIQVFVRTKDLKEKLLMILMIAGFFSFASDGMFSFPLERYEHTLFLHIMIGIVIGKYLLLFANQDLTKKYNWTRLMVFPVIGFLSWNIFLGMERHRFEYHMNRAKVFQKRKDNQKIVKEVKAGKSKWVTLDPNKDPLEIQSAMAFKNIGKAFKDKKNEKISNLYYDSAMVEAKQALAYNPHSTRNLNTLGTIYTETKRYEEAIEIYKKALYYAPFYEVTLKNLALNYIYSKDYKSCLETLEKFNYEGDEYFEKVFKVANYQLKKQEKEAAKQEEQKPKG
ncbi:MAG: O-antigen ligase family protein [Cyclobacteriaceae bacterium]